MKTVVVALASVAIMFGATSAYAECAMPETPDLNFKGRKATQEEKDAARAMVLKFLSDVQGEVDENGTSTGGYLGCLAEEEAAVLAGIDDEKERTKTEKKYIKMHDEAVDEMNALAAKYNTEAERFAKAQEKNAK